MPVKPDIALMDINLPGYGALRVLRELRLPPAVIFLTAYDQHAVTAFELAAVDYLLKPFDDKRLLVALARARSLLEARDYAVPALEDRMERALADDTPLETLFVRDRGTIIAIPVAKSCDSRPTISISVFWRVVDGFSSRCRYRKSSSDCRLGCSYVCIDRT